MYNPFAYIKCTPYKAFRLESFNKFTKVGGAFSNTKDDISHQVYRPCKARSTAVARFLDHFN